MLPLDNICELLQRPAALRQQVIRRLDARNRRHPVFALKGADWRTISAVLFLLGRYPAKDRHFGQPSLILTKRSAKVRQPGDLCCPGGTVSPRLDAALAALLRLPASPLARWPRWRLWRRKRRREAGWLRLLLATGLRESIEEMRLTPFGLTFLGPLPLQSLVMFNRVIYPMVVWISGRRRFYPNWEVEDIIYIPLRDFFDPASYARYRLRIETRSDAARISTFPCFRLSKDTGSEVLWGATYHITTTFLRLVFDFKPPDIGSVPEIYGRLSRSYHSPDQKQPR